MATYPISRRAAIAALVSAWTWPNLARAGQTPASVRHVRAIEVDVSPLRRAGNRLAADAIAEELPSLLNQSFAANLAPGDPRAPILRVSINSVDFGPSGSGQHHGQSTAMDYIDGVGALIGGSGREIASYPLESAVLAHPGPVDPTGVSGRLRLMTLLQSFAQSLPGAIGVR